MIKSICLGLYPAVLGNHCYVKDLIKPHSSAKCYRAYNYCYCKQL